jgi:hypothetical protein
MVSDKTNLTCPVCRGEGKIEMSPDTIARLELGKIKSVVTRTPLTISTKTARRIAALTAPITFPIAVAIASRVPLMIVGVYPSYAGNLLFVMPILAMIVGFISMVAAMVDWYEDRG